MDFNKEYLALAAQLGDIQYKMQLLQDQQAKILEQIKQLDKLAGMANEKKESEAKRNNSGDNSPA